MNFFERILYALQATMVEPRAYGIFHFVCIAIMLFLTWFLCKYYKDTNSKKFRKIILIAWIVMVVLEIYKQVIYTFNYSDNKVIWDYQWYAFPYQLCSTPLYLLPFITFLKEGKVRDAIMAFISTFSLFGGVVVFIYPNDVFISTIGINIQTMVHHGLQIILGVYISVYNRKKLSIKYFLSGIIVFAVMSTIAMILNAIMVNFTTETFNMFFISPYYPCTLAVLNLIYPLVPYIIFLCIYLFGFTLVAYLFYIIQYVLIDKVLNKNKETNNEINKK